MVTKGIITSIDFNGNTCQVRIPLFETAGNDPIISTAVVSNTPGSYNGYKVGDVVLVAFEDGKMETPVVIGKLYLGAEKEKADPRGSLNTESLVAAKTAAVPADTKLTTDTDKNLPNTMNPYANLSSIANNLNKLNTDVNYLDVFTNNQFSSVITDVNKQGDELRSEIKQTADNIENKVVHKHKDGSQKALGWDLNDTEWKINAQDTVVNGVVKDINIVTIDRNGMSIAGDLKLNGYPKNIVVRYAQNGSDTKYPNLYNFKPDSFPDTKIDKTWYYNKYIKITETDKEKYILISSENIDDYTITPGETVAYVYNLEEINPEWKTETPARVDGQYIWQWTHTESFSFNGDKWNEQDDDKVVCITGAQGEKGSTGIAITATKQWYILWPADAAATDKPSKPGSDEKPEPDEPENTAAPKEWMSTPPEAVNGYVVWTCQESIFSDDTSEDRHIEYSDPVKDNAYALAQGKTTNYYSPTEPVNKIKIGDCWFDTGYVKITTNPENKAGYLGKFVVPKAEPTIPIPEKDKIYVKAVKDTESDTNDTVTRYIPIGPDDPKLTYLIKITPKNIDNEWFTAKIDNAYETGNLKQWDGKAWTDIAGELVTNKLTANYINAMDITTKKIHVKDANGNTLFKANGIPGEADSNKVTIGGFDVDHNKLSIGTIGSDNSVALISDKSITPIKIAGSSEKNDWSIVAGKNFGVDSSGKAYVSDINVDGIEFDTAYYSEGVDATLSFRYGRSGHPQPEEVIDGIDVVSSTSDSNADITVWIKANIIRGVTELSNSINCVVSYAWGEWTEDDNGNKHFDKNKIFYESKNVILSAKGIPQDPQPFTNYVLVASNKPNSFLIKESVKLSVTEISTRTGNFINRRGFFVDSNNNHTSGYLFNLTPNSYAGEDNVGNEFTVKWFSDSKTEIEYDSTITLNNGNFMRVYLPSTEFKQLTSASISFHHDVDEKDTSGKEYVYEYARTNLPKFSIGKIDYSKVFSDGVIIIDIVISGLGDNETYIPKYSDCITLHVSGSNELVWETAETEKLCSITSDRSNPNVSISNANNAITLKIDGNILGITHLYFSVEAIIDGEKKDIFKSASNIGLVYDSNTRSYNLSGQLNITTLASGWCVVKASCKYLKAKMA